MPHYKIDDGYVKAEQVIIPENDWKYYRNNYHVASLEGNYDELFLRGLVEEVLQTYVILQAKVASDKANRRVASRGLSYCSGCGAHDELPSTQGERHE